MSVMEMDLFSFCFEEGFTEESIAAVLAEVVAAFKRKGNPLTLGVGSLSMNAVSRLTELAKRGVLVNWQLGNRLIQLHEDFREWHDPMEVAADYRRACQNLLDEGKTFYDFHHIRLGIDGPGVDEAIRSVRQELAWSLGIAHARALPRALGQKINLFHRKNKYGRQAMWEAVTPLNSIESVKAYFRKTLFQQPGFSSKDELVYVQLHPTDFNCACLAQSQSVDDVSLVVPYMGGTWIKADLRNYTIVSWQ